MEKKKHKNPPQLWGEEKPSKLKVDRELAHEDGDPVYPIDPIQDSKQKKKKPQ